MMALAYRLKGARFPGALGDISPAKFFQEISDFAKVANLNRDTMVRWADSLNLDPTVTAPDDCVPSYMPILGFTAKPYQVLKAAWAARRMGSVLAMGCGTGKSYTATAAAIGAVELGSCRNTRCLIVSPKNAMPQWKPYMRMLRDTFFDVSIISVDSLHKLSGLDRSLGGALIIDEAHRIKNLDSDRSTLCFDLRLRFEWCTCLTGTLLHAGPGGVVSIQDMALPGGSRFVSIRKFGEAFNCLVVKKLGKAGIRTGIGMPPEVMHAPFTEYLGRLVVSLSFESPEVAACGAPPEQTQLTLDSWAVPDWVQKLRSEKREILWLPDLSSERALAVLALATETFNKEHPELKENPQDDMSWVPDDFKPDIEKKDKPDLPSFAAIMMAGMREGVVDRAIEVIKDEVGVATHRFVYAPGSDWDNPLPGPKVQEVMRMVDEHPEEPLVIGSFSTQAKEMVVKSLRARGLRAEVIDGDTSLKVRAALKDEFQAGTLKYLVLQQIAGSESITLTAACISTLLDICFDPVPYSQFLGRVRRLGQDRESEHYDMTFIGLQSEMLGRVRRGQKFDTETREELEKRFRAAVGG
jgi:SNF2 family DNA or RNA helicase